MAEETQVQEPVTETAIPEPKEPEKAVGIVGLSQADLDVLVGKTRKEGRQSGREELLEKAGVKSEKELLDIIAERKAAKEAEMTEAEKAKALAAEEADKRLKLESELNTIKFEKAFTSAAKELQYEFATEQAERDAVGYLAGDTSADTMADRLKQLAQDRPYLFKTRVEKPEIDSKDKGTQTGGGMTEARKKELKQRFPALS